MRIPSYAALLLCLSNTPSVFADSKACFAQAETPIHDAYCEIRRRDPSIELPPMGEFKTNPSQIQRLLIKRPAQRLGIALPAESLSDATQLSGTTPAPNPAPIAPAPRREPSQNNKKENFSFANCAMSAARIECGRELYRLQVNLKNNQLRAEAFSKENQLRFPIKSETSFANESDYRYLSHLYPTYIRKMLDLGLGDSTMSFTKFATVYWQAKMNGENFHERFRQMYNQLKIEKSQNAVRARYRDNYPVDLHQCMRLDADIIVCDDMTQNWIYKRA